ncbi:MAG: patatin-like phospholipase family protein [Proteobacteria bacterium]|nr:patatin-like phospholipase family protein [Pseudomonadota bacterium]
MFESLLQRWRGSAGRPPLNLALQGGGAHGAFTWGVLDALLADGELGFEGLSGSSAGAMNAVVLAHGWAAGGRDGAREALAAFWQAIGQQLPFAMVQAHGDRYELSPTARALVHWAGLFAPTQLNPFDLNPLRDILALQIDFERLRAASPFKLFVGATQVETGKLRVFREHELTIDMLVASACLPRLHHTVTVDGEPYWDGGYTANPAVFPLFYECRSRDILLVLLSPLRHEGVPTSVAEIESRALELAFSANFMREMRTYAHATAYAGGGIAAGPLERRLRAARFHMIEASDLAVLHEPETRLLAHGPFLEQLRDQGRERALQWLAEHRAAVGRRSTLDLARWFM